MMNQKLTDYLQIRWRSPRAPWYLRPLSTLFGIVSGLRRILYAKGILRSQFVPARVVIVGNVTLGGSGKTPLVAWLAQRLSAQGVAVGIVTRGYGGDNLQARILSPDTADAGDEALWLARVTGVPVAVGRDRVSAAKLLLDALKRSESPRWPVACSKFRLSGEEGYRVENGGAGTIILSDDGLQHYRLARNVEIVAVDGARGFGNGALLPAGPLRETPARIARADAVVVKGESSPPLPPDMLVFRMHYALGDAVPLVGGPPVPLIEFRGQPVAALAGISDPESFFRELEREGLTVERYPMFDHADRGSIAEALTALGDERPIMMTDKDAAKLAVPPANAFRVPLEVTFTEAAAEALLALVRGTIAPQDSATGEKNPTTGEDRHGTTPQAHGGARD